MLDNLKIEFFKPKVKPMSGNDFVLIITFYEWIIVCK